ncbi:MAG: zeta toxin family protein [Candidatus Omnitrophica bacterium]|nr:zeta toxin family protein [Candidatus Omnitrophota bacterium]
MIKPNHYIIAGPNGSGKTTFAREFLPKYAKCNNFINADLIAQGLSPFSPQTSAIHAGRIVLKQIHDFSERRIDFGFETTLSGKTYLSLLKLLLSKGYFVRLFFLWVPDADLSLARIKERVSLGGDLVARTKDISDKAFDALKSAVRKVVEERKRLGMPVIVWKNGKVARIPASQAL